MVIDKSIWVYDVETMRSCFTYCAINKDTEQIVKFVIHKDLNQFENLIEHLKECKGHVGFNNINFDYPIIHDLIKNYEKLKNSDADIIIKLIFDKAQSLIEAQNQLEFNNILSIKESEQYIKQLDLFKLWHFNNSARKTSLKSLEIAMNFPNVMESEIDYKRDDIRLDEVDKILEYNINDVLATYEFYKRSKNKIELRQQLNQKYDLHCMNFSDSKIGEQLILKLYCQKTGKDYWDVKKLRTIRPSINLKDCIFNYIKFETKEFNKLLDTFKSKTIVETKGSIEESVIFKNAKFEYGLGGLHQCVKSGIYESDDKYIIKSADVASLYPSIAVINKLYPEHLGIEFTEVYEGVLNDRLKAKKEGNMTISDAYKLSLNSCYGKSNDKYSFLMDPKYTMQTTLNGQLMLTMLIEKLGLAGFEILMTNTDGLECKILRSDENKYNSICKEWEKLTKLTLEFVDYSKMIIGDVNNYISLSTKGKIKYKGRYVIDKEYHQDNSFRIVAIALSDYFIKNIPIEETILNHNDIYDFCGKQKFKGEDWGETHEVLIKNNNPYNHIEKQQRNVRYYISKPGKTFIKQFKKGTSSFINKGYQVTIFNKYIEKLNIKDYNIDYQFYIKECMKEIDLIIDKQLELF